MRSSPGLPAQMRDLRSVRLWRDRIRAELHARTAGIGAAARCNGPPGGTAHRCHSFTQADSQASRRVVSQDPRHIAALKFERENSRSFRTYRMHRADLRKGSCMPRPGMRL